MSYAAEAAAKLRREREGKLDKYGEIMKKAVSEAVITLAGMDEAFAEAIVKGGSFEECMKEVAKKIRGNGISDLEAFRAAVKFYEPAADVEFQMVLKRAGSEQGETRKTEGKIFDLLDIL